MFIPSQLQGRIQDFKLGGGGVYLKKLGRAEGGAKILGVFRVKNLIFSNFRGARPPPPGSAPELEMSPKEYDRWILLTSKQSLSLL